MIITKANISVKIHLIISICIVIPVAYLYGWHSNLAFNIHLNTTDELSAFKAIMGLYFGFALLWLFGVCNNRYLNLALLSNATFMLGLGFGRLISLALDGMSTLIFICGTFGELVLGFYGIAVIRNLKKE